MRHDKMMELFIVCLLICCVIMLFLELMLKRQAGPQGIPGPQGLPGERGTKLHNGPGHPSKMMLGIPVQIYDYYFNSENNTIYILREDKTWQLLSTLEKKNEPY